MSSPFEAPAADAPAFVEALPPLQSPIEDPHVLVTVVMLLLYGVPITLLALVFPIAGVFGGFTDPDLGGVGGAIFGGCIGTVEGVCIGYGFRHLSEQSQARRHRDGGDPSLRFTPRGQIHARVLALDEVGRRGEVPFEQAYETGPVAQGFPQQPRHGHFAP